MRTTEPSSLPSHPAKRLSLLLSVHDHERHGSLAVHILQRARRAGLAGATAFEGIEGFGGSGRVHRTHLLSDDAPVTIVIVDLPDRIDAFVRDAADLLDRVLMTVDEIDVVEL